MTERVVIIGGYGVFGARIAKALAKDAAFDVVVAGRDLQKAKMFCRQTSCSPAVLDVASADFRKTLAALAPQIVIDAAGPFQSYETNPYKVAAAAIACGAHYLDLSDDADFTSGISTLNEAATGAGVTLLSGVSSVPGLSSAVVASLSSGFEEIFLIESVIMPGNRAPRGLSVVKAILAQVGRGIPVMIGGEPSTVLGWSGLSRRRINSDHGERITRFTSYIGAPDLKLFPVYFRARTVLFRAGLDLSVLHLGLWFLSWLVRCGIVRSLAPMAGFLKRVADVLESVGSDIGAMTVDVIGKGTNEKIVQRRWTMIARDGVGPNIPAIPAQLICEKINRNEIAPGARSCVNEFSLETAQAALGKMNITFALTEASFRPLFRQILDEDFPVLPEEIQTLHDVVDCRRWRGRAVSNGETDFYRALLDGLPGFRARLMNAMFLWKCAGVTTVKRGHVILVNIVLDRI